MNIWTFFSNGTMYGQDWAGLQRYHEDNQQVINGKQNVIAVFLGNSITDIWIKADSAFFASNGYVDRGISGQTTPQMLLRFRADVIDLHPKVVVIEGGTNDIAGNTGPETLEMIEDNIASMCELASMHHIKVVLSSLLPAYDYWWHKGTYPSKKIVALNEWIKKYAAANHYVYLDYYSPLVDDHDAFKSAYSKDGVHPNSEGYKIMMPLAKKAVEEALAER